ncbi:ABC-F family ATP-binding cassette domain-containing protein [Adlercreutzia sp. R21]|uniref:ABC-F family ATP-binding cassette domain-containing protein n=1 Tax=Adlercreutzia wanghongyangiae TaxID=3111451 RepID=A0ABU6IIA2_9ACTN|nr:ABC-F family ATP-binding cassette domain-containing protein [Adlercreutzia sp. R21]MEC4176147.1 ABC-F family ATP-binding cassette domain-containing protein [Adlercreutzia sp. R7]MEC4183999.1 ABC-F family ATP-binding cassette domain-containing protein [Adlercreutzia sp. R21]
MKISISHATVSHGADIVLSDASFAVKGNEKIAVVGRNGCGKTTLLNLIVGSETAEPAGAVSRRSGLTVGFLRQVAFNDDSVTLEDEVRKAFPAINELRERIDRLQVRMESDPDEKVIQKYVDALELFAHQGGYEYEADYESVLRHLGFTRDDAKRPLSSFSGGQRTRIAFAQVLLNKPDVLLLDEPTNHLDIPTIQWLESYLKSYESAVVVVSHDREFLDNVAEVVYEIEYGRMERYAGNYTAFVAEKERTWDKRQRAYEAQQEEIARLEQTIESFKGHPTKAAMARAKRSQLDRMVRLEPPRKYDLKTFNPLFEPARRGFAEALEARDLALGREGGELGRLSFSIERGRKVGVIGPNGCGKSTLLETLAGRVAPLAGSFAFGGSTDLAYFEQQIAAPSGDQTVLESFWSEFPGLTNNEARGALGSFLLGGDDVNKAISRLSGGERARLELCRMMARRPNFLLLDEPTNHMDIPGKEALARVLRGYAGTVLFVSHDRAFLRAVADALIVFDPVEGAYYFPYGYDEYAEVA